MTGFRKLSERQVWEGHVIEVAVGCFADPDGEEFERELVHHPGAVSVVAYDDDEKSVILLRQYRASIDAELLEIPAGKLDVDGEGLEATARRELEEEVGLRAGRLEKLAEFFNSPGFSDEHSVVYLARDLEQHDTDLQGVEEEHMTVERVPLDDVPELISAGEITDAKTIIGLCLAREHLAG
jgi:nudix-type nucleoside diphosphatase (YffH/AdpP family)